LLTILIICALVWGKFHPSQTKELAWRKYTSDTFLGLRWQWCYSNDGEIYDLYSFCPYCNFQIFPYNIGAFQFSNRIEFRCDSCGMELGKFDESPRSLENKVKRFIQQKIRNGTWVKQNQHIGCVE
jgi:hypothetical protein